MGVCWPSVILDVFRSPIDASPAPAQYEALMWSGSPTVASDDRWDIAGRCDVEARDMVGHGVVDLVPRCELQPAVAGTTATVAITW